MTPSHEPSSRKTTGHGEGFRYRLSGAESRCEAPAFDCFERGSVEGAMPAALGYCGTADTAVSEYRDADQYVDEAASSDAFSAPGPAASAVAASQASPLTDSHRNANGTTPSRAIIFESLGDDAAFLKAMADENRTIYTAFSLPLRFRTMGEVRATIQVSNTLAPDTPAIELDCLVDTGAVMTLIPKDVLDKLGIAIIGRAAATLANEESGGMDVAGPLNN